MAKKPVIEFQKLSPGIYKILSQPGFSGAIMDWGGASAAQLPQKFMPIVRTSLPATFKFELVEDGVLYKHVLVTQQNVPGWDDIPQKPKLFFHTYPDALAYVSRINNPLVQDLLTNPVLLDQAAGFIDSCAPGTDIAKELRAVARALHDGKPYAICSNDDCVWSDHVDVQEIVDYTDCPECGKLADIKR